MQFIKIITIFASSFGGEIPIQDALAFISHLTEKKSEIYNCATTGDSLAVNYLMEKDRRLTDYYNNSRYSYFGANGLE